jgi:hypothetical protein
VTHFENKKLLYLAAGERLQKDSKSWEHR